MLSKPIGYGVPKEFVPIPIPKKPEDLPEPVVEWLSGNPIPENPIVEVDEEWEEELEQ